jgi:hypothetical protein
MSEQRRTPRQKSLIRGIVHFANIPFASECLVRDLSELGARIKFDRPPAATSDLLELHLPVKGQKLKARVCWRNGDEFGVRFDALPPEEQESLEARLHRLEGEIATLRQLIKRLQRVNEPAADVA